MAESAPELQKSLKSRHMTMISPNPRLGSFAEYARRSLGGWAGFSVAVIASMALVKDVRSQLIPSFISLAVVLAAYWSKSPAERQSSAVAAGAS